MRALRSPLIRVLLFGLGLAFCVGLYVLLDLGQYLSFEALKRERDQLASFVEEHYLLTLLVFTLIYYASVALSLPVATGLSLLAGFLFGPVVGTVVVVTTATVGATTVFLLARTFLGEVVVRWYGARLTALATAFRERAFGTLLFMRLVPLFPFVLVNVAPAFARVPTRTFALATLIGILPGSAVFVFAGTQLAQIESPSEVLSPTSLLALLLLGLVALVPELWKRTRGGAAAAADGVVE
ncbi:TVP38/TMEM64 family protein [Patescibacteria group bacterium]|jgi:uncharacterized membrane protein YdjX (TVP38/TMEM64 family)|nr:TVP38/TMEM64 family protein [Patescibacteria group bacterium]